VTSVVFNPQSPWVRSAYWGVTGFSIFFALASLSLLLLQQSDQKTLVWFANLAMGLSLIRRDRSEILTILVAAAMANLLVYQIFGSGWVTGAMTVPANVAEILLVSLMARQDDNYVRAFHSTRRFTRALTMVCFIPVLIGSLIATSVHYLSGGANIEAYWLSQATGSLVGGVIIFGLGISLIRYRPSEVLKQIIEPTSLIFGSFSFMLTVVALTSLPYPFIYIAAGLFLTGILSNFVALSWAVLSNGVLVTLLLASGSHEPLVAVDHGPLFSGLLLYLPMLLAFAPPLILCASIMTQRDSKLRLRRARDHYVALYEKMPAAMHSGDSEDRIVAVSDAWLRLLGYERHQVIGRKASEFIVTQGSGTAGSALRPTIFEAGYIDNARIQLRCKTGEPIDVSYSAVVDSDRDDNQILYSAVIENVSNEVSLSRELETERDLMQVTLKSIGDGVLTTNLEQSITFINPVAEAILGIDSSAGTGRKFQEVVQLFDQDTGKPLIDPLAKVILDRSIHVLPDSTCIRSASGEVYNVKNSIAPIMDSYGNVHGAVMVFQDVTASRAVAQQMTYLAQHDALTDLPNRVLLFDRLTQACSRSERYREDFSLIFIDVDNFKSINDTLGHEAGDQLLKVIAGRLRDNTRESDTVSRIGGDEFVVILDSLSRPEDVSRYCEKLLRVISRPVELSGKDYLLTPSMGVAICPRDGVDAQTLMRRADAAMYAAKAAGRNGFNFYSKQLEAEVEHKVSLEQKVRAAVDNDEFELYYQPIVSSGSGNDVCYAEALCRWPSPEGFHCGPDEFIRVAEENRFIEKLGWSLFARACSDLKYFVDKEDLNLSISLNFSSIQLVSKGLVNQIRTMLEEAELPASSFVFEITETSLLANREESIDILHRLKELGIRIALDDFGTGYSSLSYLKSLPIDIVKIDREFVRDLETDPQDLVFVRAIVSMAHSLSLEVVAEGVETDGQARILRDMGVAFHQGYFYSQPVKRQDLKHSLGLFGTHVLRMGEEADI